MFQLRRSLWLSEAERQEQSVCCVVMVVLASRVELVEEADGAGEQRQHWRSSRQHCSGLASKAEWWGELQQSTREHGRCLTLSYRADNAIVWGASPASRLLVPPRRSSARIAIPLYHYWLIQPNIHWDNIYNHPVEKASQIDSRNKNIFTISSITVFITVVKYVVGVRKGKVTLLSNLVICKHDHYRESRLHNLNLLIICSWNITCTYLYIDWKSITCIVNLMTLRSVVCQRTG